MLFTQSGFLVRFCVVCRGCGMRNSTQRNKTLPFPCTWGVSYLFCAWGLPANISFPFLSQCICFVLRNMRKLSGVYGFVNTSKCKNPAVNLHIYLFSFYLFLWWQYRNYVRGSIGQESTLLLQEMARPGQKFPFGKMNVLEDHAGIFFLFVCFCGLTSQVSSKWIHQF